MKKNILFLLFSMLTISLTTTAYGRTIEETKQIGKASLNSADTLPNYYYQLPILDADFEFHHYAALGDVNGDGFSDIGVVAMKPIGNNEPSIYGRILLLVYHGSSSGLNRTPDNIINLIHYPPSRTSRVNGIGDVNGDGYDDVYYWEDIYFGSADGLNSTLGWELYRDPNNHSREYYFNSMDGRAFPAGDLNNDGYDDFLAPASDMGNLYIFLGKSPLGNTPSASYWIGLDDFTNLVGLAAGDMNGDGYDDFIFHGYDYYSNAYAFLGSPKGFNYQFVWRHFRVQQYFPSRDITISDVNGDGYNDINVLLHFEESNNTVEALFTIYGSASGPDTANHDTLFKKYYIYTTHAGRLYAIGDINRDGFEDIQVTSIPEWNKEPLEPYILYGSDTGLVNEPDFSYKEFHHMQKAGDINGDGYPDLMADHGDGKSLVILYSKESIPDPPPVVTCLPDLKFCYDSSGNYSIPEPEISGEVRSIRYSIQGSTRRSGDGMDASGYFKPGNSSIIWSVTGMNDQVITCTTAVLVSNPISVYIKPGLAHPQGAVPGEIYLGYGANSYRIVAIPAGNSGPYTYKWSDGSTEKFTRIRHNSVGSYPYHVELTNRDGCKANAAYTIQVKNVRCISPLEDLFAKFFPSLYKDPAILKLFHNAAEIQLCKEGKTFCSPKSKVAALLNQGATLGSCAVTIPETVGNTLKAAPIPEHAGLDVQVYPNPSRSNFRFLIQGPRNTGQIIILTLSGQQLERINYFSGNVIEIGSALKAGTYIAEVISGNERKVLKLVKLQ